MGGKTSTTTQQVSIPKEVMDRYNAINARAEQVASKPFQIYSTDPSAFVAQLNQQQLTGIGNVNAAAGSYQPYLASATDATKAGMASAMPGELEIGKYMNPYQKDVIDATMARMRQEQEQAQSGALGTAISSGAFGGDRAGIAAANLAQQQGMATGQTLAGLNAQNFAQALQTAQQQQGLNLGAEQANLARLLSGGQQLAGLGQAAQAMGLQGAEAQINAGTLGQQTEQAGLSALYNQFMQQQAYPFQVAQFLANIGMGTGALSGSTTTTTQPAPFFSDRRLKKDIKRIGKTDDGLPIYKFKYKGDPEEQTHIGFMADEVEEHAPKAVGLDPSGYKTVDYDRATKADGGGVAGPYGMMVGSQPGAGGYVPQAYLPVGELMVADSSGLAGAQRSFAEQLEAAANFGESLKSLDEDWKWAKEKWGNRKRAGLVGEAEEARGVSGYASGGPAYLEGGVKPADNPVQKEGYLSDTVKSQEEGKKNQIMQPGGMPDRPESGLKQLGDAASAIASIFALSDRRMKHSIRRIGKTDNGMPIYSFKYKGDDREQTHIGFMADEVERKHPDAVTTGSDGMKRVDYAQAGKFYQGGLVRHGYATDGAVEDEIRRRRLLSGDVPAAQTLGSMPDAVVTPAREAMPTEDLTGLARAAINRSDVKPAIAPEPGLVPAATRETRAPAVDPSAFYRSKIIQQESGGRQFDENGRPLTSSAGAIGIGQIMPDTGPEAAKMAGLPWDEVRFRTDPEYNAALGEAYFLNMYDRFGSLDLASAAYNAGPGRLSSAIDRAAAMGGSYLDYLPEETRNYVASVTGAGSTSRGVAGATTDIPAYDGVVNTMSSSGLAGGAGSNSTGEGYSGGLGLTSDKPYKDRTTLGKMFYNPDGTVNRDALMSLASGVGAMLSSPSQFFLPSLGLGLQGAASTYAGLEQQRGAVTKQNLENANEFMKSYMRAVEYGGYNGTAEDYAKDIKYTGPISLTDGLIGTQDRTGSAREFMGAPLDPFGRGMSAVISVEGPDGEPVEVMAGQTLGYLKALETKLARDVEMGISTPALLEQVRNAIANHRGQITTSDGRTIADPTFRDAAFGAAGQESDELMTVDLTKNLPQISQSAYEARRNTDELARALSEMPTTGILSPWVATFGNVATQLGLAESSDAATAYEKALKVISGDIEASMSQLGGSVDTSVLANAIRNARANPTMTAGAIEELLAIRAGMADYQIARAAALNLARRNPNANLAQVDREFAYDNPIEGYIEARRPQYEGTIGTDEIPEGGEIPEGSTDVDTNGRPIIFRDGRWVLQ